MLDGQAGELDTAAHIELPVDRPQVVVDGVRRDEQSLADLTVGEALGDERRHARAVRAGDARGRLSGTGGARLDGA